MPCCAPQVPLATQASPVVSKLAAIDINRMTPLEALTLLAELKALVDRGAARDRGDRRGSIVAQQGVAAAEHDLERRARNEPRDLVAAAGRACAVSSAPTLA